jgi:hypothetical protein
MSENESVGKRPWLSLSIHKGHGFSLLLAVLFSVGIIAAFAAVSGTVPVPGHGGAEIADGSITGAKLADNLTINDTFVKFVNRSGSNSITFNLSRGNGTTVIGADFINITNTTQATGQRGNVPYGCRLVTQSRGGAGAGTVTASCSTGEIVVGGGMECGSISNFVQASHPASSSLLAWAGNCANAGGASTDSTDNARAICCKV